MDVERAFRSHLGLSCLVLGLVLTVLAAFMSPGGDLVGAFIWQAAAIALTVVIYLVLRREARG
jgi:hypothetical protein